MAAVYELKITSHFSAAHQLREFHGKCERLHGHNWKVDVFVKGKDLGSDGLLMDFGLIKEATRKLLQRLDHQFLNDLEAFREPNPSSENIARYIYIELGHALNNETVRVSRVTAWESDTACATYMEP